MEKAPLSVLESKITETIDQISRCKKWDIPLDYFNWGRDPRHTVRNLESLPERPFSAATVKGAIKKTLNNALGGWIFRQEALGRFRDHYRPFQESYQLMSDEPSRTLFAELIVMMLVSEKAMRLSSFTVDFIQSYERSSREILSSDEVYSIYGRELRKVILSAPQLSIYTDPTILNLHHTGRLYRYQRGAALVDVNGGDIVLDAGVGWGDTTMYLAAKAGRGPGGHSYAFDILAEGLQALADQRRLNPDISNVTPVLRALYDADGQALHISSPSPGARVVDDDTGVQVETITIDSFVREQDLPRVDFIKMDIEGAEVPALRGARQTITKFKPRLAISVYHKWDDLLTIPLLIHSMNQDYEFYLDCTTGFGGEAVLYCR